MHAKHTRSRPFLHLKCKTCHENRGWHAKTRRLPAAGTGTCATAGQCQSSPWASRSRAACPARPLAAAPPVSPMKTSNRAVFRRDKQRRHCLTAGLQHPRCPQLRVRPRWHLSNKLVAKGYEALPFFWRQVRLRRDVLQRLHLSCCLAWWTEHPWSARRPACWNTMARWQDR